MKKSVNKQLPNEGNLHENWHFFKTLLGSLPFSTKVGILDKTV